MQGAEEWYDAGGREHCGAPWQMQSATSTTSKGPPNGATLRPHSYSSTRMLSATPLAAAFKRIPSTHRALSCPTRQQSSPQQSAELTVRLQ